MAMNDRSVLPLPLRRFANDQRVTVIDRAHPCYGQRGRVVRLRRADDGAWVRMDGPVPTTMRRFPGGDDRSNDVLLYPDQCARMGAED